MFHWEVPQHHSSTDINTERNVPHLWCLTTEIFQLFLLVMWLLLWRRSYWFTENRMDRNMKVTKVFQPSYFLTLQQLNLFQSCSFTLLSATNVVILCRSLLVCVFGLPFCITIQNVNRCRRHSPCSIAARDLKSILEI